MASEFDLISRFFANKQAYRSDVTLGAGDDCAILTPPKGKQIVTSTDMLLSGSHFLPNVDPAWLAHKSLACNLSDLAAMGAEPAWVSLGISLPHYDEQWLSSFSSAFFKLANHYNLQLIGGDTTKGHLALSLTISGFVDHDTALLRTGAKVGDDIYVSGHLGAAAAGLAVMLEREKYTSPLDLTLLKQHFYSDPRVNLGLALRNVAHSAIDISDGVLADLKHILAASKVGAEIHLQNMPVSNDVIQWCHHDIEAAQMLALKSGEEYELCFTVGKEHALKVQEISATLGIPLTKIGEVIQQAGLHCYNQDHPFMPSEFGHDHFKK
ncbi:thiamine-phosphate kinase [Vibrio sp.]|nr:thiamine-phosphate kinase [Vibrio sp.]